MFCAVFAGGSFTAEDLFGESDVEDGARGIFGERYCGLGELVFDGAAENC